MGERGDEAVNSCFVLLFCRPWDALLATAIQMVCRLFTGTIQDITFVRLSFDLNNCFVRFVSYRFSFVWFIWLSCETANPKPRISRALATNSRMTKPELWRDYISNEQRNSSDMQILTDCIMQTNEQLNVEKTYCTGAKFEHNIKFQFGSAAQGLYSIPALNFSHL